MKNREIHWPGWETGKVLGRGGYSTVYEISRNTTIEEVIAKTGAKLIIPENVGYMEDVQ